MCAQIIRGHRQVRKTPPTIKPMISRWTTTTKSAPARYHIKSPCRETYPAHNRSNARSAPVRDCALLPQWRPPGARITQAISPIAFRMTTDNPRASGTAAGGTHRRLRRSAVRALSYTVGSSVAWVYRRLGASRGETFPLDESPIHLADESLPKGPDHEDGRSDDVCSGGLLHLRHCTGSARILDIGVRVDDASGDLGARRMKRLSRRSTGRLRCFGWRKS